jgi:hypothetical protein
LGEAATARRLIRDEGHTPVNFSDLMDELKDFVRTKADAARSCQGDAPGYCLSQRPGGAPSATPSPAKVLTPATTDKGQPSTRPPDKPPALLDDPVTRSDPSTPPGYERR